MKDYYLIARNLENNSFKVLSINDKWYLGSQGTDSLSRNNSLPAIDLVTSRFRSREEMAERLFKNGYIDSPNVEFFIARRSKNATDGKDAIRFREVIYNPVNTSRMQAARSVMKAAVRGEIDSASEAITYVYEELINSIYFSGDLYEMIANGEMSIDLFFAERLGDIRLYESAPSGLGKGGYISRSYNVFRGVVESLNRFELLAKTYGENCVEANSNLFYSNLEGRRLLIPELLVQLDRDYDENQLSLFDFIEQRGECQDNQETVTEEQDITSAEQNPSTEVPEEPIEPVSIDTGRTLTSEEKKKEVFHFLETLSVRSFVRDEKTGKYGVNYKVFAHPILDEERERLDKLLTGNMPKFFASYALNKQRIKDAQYYCGASEIEELQYMARRDLNAIRTRFKSEKCIARTYEWCMLYQALLKRDAQYQTSGIQTGGEKSGKVYCKK